MRPTPLTPDEMVRDVLGNGEEPSTWWPAVEGLSSPRHSRGATRCGLCGELTEAEVCCGEAVW